MSWLSVFPAFVRPISEEVFSSWLVRNAHAHELKVHTFYKILDPSTSVWNRDIDKSASLPFLELMANRCDTPIELAKDTLLSSYEGKLFDKIIINGSCRWISPCGIYHRMRKNRYINYCPGCLERDKEKPYYRKSWRLSLFNICCVCRCELRNYCPSCKSPVHFFRTELGAKDRYPGASICVCTICGFDLRLSNTVKVGEIDICNQLWLEEIIDKGLSLKPVPTDSVSIFNVLFLLISVLRAGKNKTIGLQDMAFSQIEEERPLIVPRSGFSFDFEQEISNKKVFLNAAIYLLQEWPDRFIKTCVDNKIGKAPFTRFQFDQNLPLWFSDVLKKIRLS